MWIVAVLGDNTTIPMEMVPAAGKKSTVVLTRRRSRRKSPGESQRSGDSPSFGARCGMENV
jgi:hypothetical protein